MTCRRCQCHLAGFAKFCPRCGTAVRRPNRVARLMVGLLVIGGIGFFALVGSRSSSARRAHYQQVYPPTSLQPTHQTWPEQPLRPGSIRVYSPDGSVEVVEEINRSYREVERRER